METIFYAEINAVGIIMMIIMLLSRPDAKTALMQPDQILFRALLWCNMAILIFDTGTWVFRGASTAPLILISNISNAIYFILNPILCLIWAIYCVYKITGSFDIIQKWFGILIIPVVAVMVLSVTSPWTHLIFYVSDTGNYVRGSLFLIIPALSFVYYFFAFLFTLVNKLQKKPEFEPRMFDNLLTFPILPFVGSIIQTICFGLSVIWICSSLSLMFLYVNLQNRQLYSDVLTGLYNRRFFEKQLINSLHSDHKNQFLFVIMIDLDRFKLINDKYGHTVGDNALIAASKILQKCCSPADVAARYGGDEFVITGARQKEEEVSALVDDINNKCEEFNSKRIIECSISFSIGYSVIEPCKSGISHENLIKAADQKMYEQKLAKKAASALKENQ